MPNEIPDEVNFGKHEIAEARKAILSHYTAQQNGSVTRLVGFVIGLFTLLQLAQALGDKAFSKIFGNFPSLIQFTLPWEGDVLKTLFLFFGTWIILYFIVRSISRFAVYGYLSSQIMYVTEGDAKDVIKDEAKRTNKKSSEFNDLGIWALSTATLRSLYDAKTMKIYYLVPVKWFFSLPSHPKYPNREKTGFGVLLIVSWFFAFLLLLFLW